MILSAITLFIGMSYFNSSATAALPDEHELRFIQVQATSKEERSQIANFGMSIEAVRSDSVWGFAHQKEIQSLTQSGYKILGNYDLEIGRGGHENGFGFPPKDSRFHTYQQLNEDMNQLHLKYPDITQLKSIGKSIEGRDLWAFHINTSKISLQSGESGKPGIVFMGNHHAREHVSLEIPLMLTHYLLEHQNDPKIKQLLDSRDIWIIPCVNPDGAEYDVSKNRYLWWRKNRRKNQDGTFGVDLNRNYGFHWGTGGSEQEPSSEVYRGTEAFSEPETQAIRDFVRSLPNTKILLSFHTFSELILYPWGYQYDAVTSSKDNAVFTQMAKTMANWNHYKPIQSSELYISSGDTTDWAYGELGIFAFTFELSPNSMFNGGFYPGAKILDKVFQDNLAPCLYLMEMAGNPYQALETEPTGMLKNYREPRETWNF